MGKFKDLTGTTYGRLTVLHFVGINEHKKSRWSCLCSCGTEVVVSAGDMISGKTKSCGCLRKELLIGSGIYKGKSGTPEYAAWWCARDRTTNPDSQYWSDYGGRGIKMCQEWEDSFDNFIEDMSYSPGSEFSLDRIDVNGNYCKENCRWAEGSTQAHNKRKSSGCSSIYRGVYLHKASNMFLANICLNGSREYVGCYSDEYEAALAYDNRSEQLYGDRPNKTIKEHYEDCI